MRSSRSDTGHPEGRLSGPEPADGATPDSGGGHKAGDWPESDELGELAELAELAELGEMGEMGEMGEPGACLAIQIDLSAMADGELDPPAVRRALAHSDVCADCSAFAASVRSQAALHRALFAPAQDGSSDAALAGVVAGLASGGRDVRASAPGQRSSRARRFDPDARDPGARAPAPLRFLLRR